MASSVESPAGTGSRPSRVVVMRRYILAQEVVLDGLVAGVVG